MVDTNNASATVLGVTGKTGKIETWKQLVAALKRVTKSPGAKAQLAATMNTTRQNVNKWLHDDGQPTAERTIKLLRWVEKQEAKP